MTKAEYSPATWFKGKLVITKSAKKKLSLKMVVALSDVYTQLFSNSKVLCVAPIWQPQLGLTTKPPTSKRVGLYLIL